MVKNFLDKFLALIGLFLLFPVLVVIWGVLRVKTPDVSPFFKQKRVGKSGVLFTIIKFRTMLGGDENNSITVAGETRITPFGAFLRKYKLDELPELWNVLKGDMSIVGPRPDVSGYADKLEGENRKILKLKPGITGPASLKYANEENILAKVKNPKKYNDEVIFPDKVKINLHYYYNRSLIKDFKIIINTIFRTNY